MVLAVQVHCPRAYAAEQLRVRASARWVRRPRRPRRAAAAAAAASRPEQGLSLAIAIMAARATAVWRAASRALGACPGKRQQQQPQRRGIGIVVRALLEVEELERARRRVVGRLGGPPACRGRFTKGDRTGAMAVTPRTGRVGDLYNWRPRPLPHAVVRAGNPGGQDAECGGEEFLERSWFWSS